MALVVVYNEVTTYTGNTNGNEPQVAGSSKKGVGTMGGRWYNDGIRLGDVVGQAQMGNVG